MTQQLQEFIYASEDFRGKSEKLAQSIEINSFLLADSSTEKAGQRNTILSKLCRQAAQAKEAGNAMEAAMQNLEKELAAVRERQYQQQKEMQQSKGQEKGGFQMSSEITDAVQVIHILFEGTDLFLRVAGAGIKPLKQLAKLFMGILAKEKMEGKTSMKNLLKRGGDMHVFKFPQEQLKKVEAMAKKYGILYSLLPDFNKDGMREMVFHAESLPRMNALIEKLKAGQVMGLDEYFQDTSGRDIDKFYEEMKGRASENGAGKETKAMQKNTASRGQEQKQPWMETGYLKMKDIEAIPLDQRLNILDRYQSGEYDPITITGKLITEQKEDYVTVRLPRQTGKFIRIPAEDFHFPEGSRTALAFLKKKEEMKVYTEHGSEMFSMKGSEVFHNYFDTVNANIRTAMEHKADERERDQGDRENSKESSRADRTTQPETGKPAKDMAEKTAKDTAEKVRAIKKEIKQPVKGR